MRRRFKLTAFISLVALFALGILLPLILHASTDDNARSVKVADAFQIVNGKRTDYAGDIEVAKKYL